MVVWSLLAGLVSGICWLVGDICLVGFEVDEAGYGDFVAGSRIGNQRLALLMLAGSRRRLRWGALWAQFSIPLMLAGLYALLELTDKGIWSYLAVGLLGLGFAWSPVAHVAFYQVGVISRTAYKRSAGGPCSELDADLINEAVHFLDLTWRPAVGITALGWLGYSILIWSGQTQLPVFFGFLTPLFGSLLVVFAVDRLRLGRPYLNGAAFNLALSAFFALVLLAYLFFL